MNIVLFEDKAFSNLHPLCLTRPVCDLRCGMLSLREKVERTIESLISQGKYQRQQDEPFELYCHTRGYLSSLCDGSIKSYEEIARSGKDCLLLNARLLANACVLEALVREKGYIHVCGDSIVGGLIEAHQVQVFDRFVDDVIPEDAFETFQKKEVRARLVAYPWDLIKENPHELEADFNLLGGSGIYSEVTDGVWLVEEGKIRIESDVLLSPGVVIDATEGPIRIDGGVRIMANACLTGPLYIGTGSIIKIGAKIYGETSIGKVCKIGGEVGESIFHGYSNKQHDGFVGHSYICEWVNLGAGTDTSDMKNNYSNISIQIGDTKIDSGEMFAGLFIGDHSKSGIGTMFNSGTVVGVCCNIFGGDYPPKYVPSFVWGGSGGFEEYILEKALETARRAMARRDHDLTPEEEKVLRKVFELTMEERQKFLAGG